MVGLPARGKSYITKKIQRYLSWQQHNTRIFNVGNRRRVAAGVSGPISAPPKSPKTQNARLGMRTGSIGGKFDAPTEAAHILLNGNRPPPAVVEEEADGEELTKVDSQTMPEPETMDQSAGFFDPSNTKASQIREQVALSTLDELLDYLLNQDGSVGILDATNSTVERRKLLFKHIKDREPKLGILFIESVCEDKNVSLTLNFVLRLLLILTSFLKPICVLNCPAPIIRTRILRSHWRTSRSAWLHTSQLTFLWAITKRSNICNTSR